MPFVKKAKLSRPATSKLHKRNLHQGRYDLAALTAEVPELKKYLTKNPKGEDTINFSNPEAVLGLNKALLVHYYDLKDWFIPKGYLCPPIPGRTDYIHYLADLLAQSYFGRMPKAKVLDIGTGANLIYPITGTHLYNWDFVGSDIDATALENARAIIAKNQRLEDKIELRTQVNKTNILEGILDTGDQFDLVMCNPPFYQSAEEALGESSRKFKNINKGKEQSLIQNFSGQSNELWYVGGEKRFLSTMVNESKEFGDQCFWFSSLVAKSSHLKGLQNSLDYHKAEEVKVIPMSQGNKASRILAWTFLTKEQQKEWRKKNWSI